MTDCSQLQTLLDQAIQDRQDLNDPTYCDDFPDPEECRKNLGAQKRAADQVIQDIKQNMFICGVLIGTWTINADSPQFSGEFAITAYDPQRTVPPWNADGEISTPDSGGGFLDAVNFDAGTNLLTFVYPGEGYRGTVNLTTQPPTIISGSYGATGTWSGQKL